MNYNEAWGQSVDWAISNKNNSTGIVSSKTKSMYPYLNGGEILLMQKVDISQINIGDLIIIGRWDKPEGVCHMVIDISATRIKTQGLNCMFSDGWKEKQYVKRKVMRVIKIIK